MEGLPEHPDDVHVQILLRRPVVILAPQLPGALLSESEERRHAGQDHLRHHLFGDYRCGVHDEFHPIVDLFVGVALRVRECLPRRSTHPLHRQTFHFR